MQLQKIEQIVNGMQVFMPSGITATLSMDEEGNIIVEYRDELDSLTDVYTKDDFGNLIVDGIEVLEQPSQMVLETMNADKVFELDQQIARLENQLIKVRDQINALPKGSTLTREQGQLFTDRDDIQKQIDLLKKKREGHLNENKIEDMNRLEKLSKCAKTPEARRKANSLLTSLGMGVDVKDEVKKFLKKMDKEMKKDESLNEVSDEVVNNTKKQRQKNYTKAFRNFKKVAKQTTDLNDPEQLDKWNKATLDYGRSYEKKERNKLLNKLRNNKVNEDQYESPDEEEFYIVTFTDGTTDNGFSYADGELFYNNEFIADIIDVDLYPEITDKIVTYCELELGKGVEAIMDGAGQIWESMNEISTQLKNKVARIRLADARREAEKENQIWREKRDMNDPEFKKQVEITNDKLDKLNRHGKVRDITNIKENAMNEIRKMAESLNSLVDKVNSLYEQYIGVTEEYHAAELDGKWVIKDKDGFIMTSDKFDTKEEAEADIAKHGQPKKDVLPVENGHVNKVEEAFKDEMSMLTDINDTDFPQAFADTVETTEDGEPLTLAKAVEEIKDQIEQVKDEIKDEIKDIDDQVEAELSAEDLADIEEVDFEDKADEQEIDDEVIEEVEEDIEKEQEEAEEEKDEDKEDKEEKDEEDDKEKDKEKEDEEEKLEEGFTQFLKKGCLEDLQKTKQEIDKMNQQGKEAKDIKDTITMMADDKKEETAAKEYAINKIKESLFNSQYNCKLANLNK